MTLDDLETRLRSDGAAWRAEQTPTPGAEAQIGTRRRATGVLAAAIVAALIGGGLWLAFGMRSTPHPRTTRPAGLPPASCAADFVVDRAVSSPANRGGRLVQVVFTNSGSRPCRISAYGPPLSIVNGSGRVVASAQNTDLTRIGNGRIEVPPGRAVRFRFTWSGGSCDPRQAPYSFVLQLAYPDPYARGSGITARPPVSPPACTPGDSALSRIFVAYRDGP